VVRLIPFSRAALQDARSVERAGSIREGFMFSRKALMFLAAVFFLVVGLGGFYRLMFGYEITLGSLHVGHVASYLVFVVCIGLSIALFRESKDAR